MTPDLATLGKLADTCIHCGLCLPACPTYTELGAEPDSPRGRIYLMRALIEGRQGATPDVLVHLDRCLGCRACETACPSGVHYGRLLEGVRGTLAEPGRRMGLRTLFWRPILRQVMPDRRRFRLLVAPLRLLARGDRQWLPATLRRAVDALPPAAPIASPAPGPTTHHPHGTGGHPSDRHPQADSRLGPCVPARGPRKGTAGFLTGCVMPALFPDVNAAAVRLLAAAGYDVVIPQSPTCCGALQAHDGDLGGADRAAASTMAAFDGCDIVVTNSAGCGAAMKDYPDPAFASRVRDLSEALIEADWWPDRPLEGFRAVFHDPCHLRHGQRVTTQPRELLRRAGLLLAEAAEPDICCGGAGSYTLLQPALSSALMARKVKNLSASAPEIIVTANPSCLMQIRAGLAGRADPPALFHLAEVLAQTLD